jgi:hypothetical protein
MDNGNCRDTSNSRYPTNAEKPAVKAITGLPATEEPTSTAGLEITTRPPAAAATPEIAGMSATATEETPERARSIGTAGTPWTEVTPKSMVAPTKQKTPGTVGPLATARTSKTEGTPVYSQMTNVRKISKANSVYFY